MPESKRPDLKKSLPTRSAAGQKPADARLAAAQERAAALTSSGGAKPDQFVREAWTELKKTTWPDRETLQKSVGVVLAFIAVTAVWNGGIDYILRQIALPLLGR